MNEREEELRFNILLAFDIFLLVLILYLSGEVSGGSKIGNSWIYATVITLSIAIFIRTVAVFVSASPFLLFKNFSHRDAVKVLAYLCLIISAIFQLYAVAVLLSI